MLPRGQFMRRGTSSSMHTQDRMSRLEDACLRACAGLGHIALRRGGVPAHVVSRHDDARAIGPTNLQPVGNLRVQLPYMLHATVEHRHGLRGRERGLRMG